MFLAAPAAAQQALHCDGLAPTAPGDATRAFECVSKLSADLSDALVRIASLEEDTHKVPKQQLVPKGAVFAFDTPDGCPEGWSHFAEAQSRAIVGASAGSFEDGLANDEDGSPLIGLKYRGHGGWQMVALTEAQMPRHRHAYGDRSVASRGDAKMMTDGPLRGWEDRPRETEVSGGSDAHPNMPPYIALYFCKKD